MNSACVILNAGTGTPTSLAEDLVVTIASDTTNGKAGNKRCS